MRCPIETAADTAAATVVTLMHRKPLMMRPPVPDSAALSLFNLAKLID